MSVLEALDEAERLSREGRLDEASTLLRAALERHGPSAALFAARARHDASRRRFASAGADLQRALRLEPRDPALHAQALELAYRLGRAGAARRALERARRSGVDARWLEGMRVRLLLSDGRVGEAERAIAALEREVGAPALFLRGCLALKRREWARAERLFGEEERSLPEGVSDRRRASFYRVVAAALTGAGRRPRGPALTVCGLGLGAPYSATVGALRALASADVAFNNVSGPEAHDLVSLLCPLVLPCTYDNVRDEPQWLGAIEAELARGRRVAFATRGHALVYGELGARLVARARLRGVPLNVEAGLSILEVAANSVAALRGRALARPQVRDFKVAASARLDASRPALILALTVVPAEQLVGAARRLLSVYPGGDAWLFGPVPEAPPRLVDLRALAQDPPARLDPSLMLLVTPASK